MFDDPAIADYYARLPIMASEVMLFLTRLEDFRDKSVLDLGVGSGRTTQYLLPFASRYVGVDYSQTMLSRCSQRFPNATLLLDDVRELSALQDERFDFVLASFNLVDGFSAADRSKIFLAARRHTQPTGIFAFSSHNRSFDGHPSHPIPEWSRNPVTLVANLLRHRREMANYRRTKPQEEYSEEYAILCDPAGGWQTLSYHIDRTHQEAQVRRHGFNVTSVIDSQGKLLPPDDLSEQSPQLYYVCEPA